jgi:hypothetical protein
MIMNHRDISQRHAAIVARAERAEWARRGVIALLLTSGVLFMTAAVLLILTH